MIGASGKNEAIHQCFQRLMRGEPTLMNGRKIYQMHQRSRF